MSAGNGTRTGPTNKIEEAGVAMHIFWGLGWCLTTYEGRPYHGTPAYFDIGFKSCTDACRGYVMLDFPIGHSFVGISDAVYAQGGWKQSRPWQGW